jgi:mannose-6-phosphate isomerase-like protein (cupin superfamily)
MATVSHTIPSSRTTEVLQLGPLTIRILASGTHTSSVILTISPHTAGFPVYFHRMHQVSFFILRGTARFVATSPSLAIKRFNAKVGEFVKVRVGARYGFSNPFDVEAELFVTYAPGYYVDFWREMARACEGGKALSSEEQASLMRGWATTVGGEQGGAVMTEDVETEEDVDEGDDEDMGGGPQYQRLMCMA